MMRVALEVVEPFAGERAFGAATAAILPRHRRRQVVGAATRSRVVRTTRRSMRFSSSRIASRPRVAHERIHRAGSQRRRPPVPAWRRREGAGSAPRAAARRPAAHAAPARGSGSRSSGRTDPRERTRDGSLRRDRDWLRRSAGRRCRSSLAAHALERAILQHAQQQELRAGAISPISSRKSVPPRASSNRPRFNFAAPVNAPFVAEQLAVHRGLRIDDAVGFDERAELPGRRAVDRARAVPCRSRSPR